MENLKVKMNKKRGYSCALAVHLTQCRSYFVLIRMCFMSKSDVKHK